MLKKKRPILCWQMVVSVLMLLGVFASSFLTHFRIDESDLTNLYESMGEKTEDLSEVKVALTDVHGMEKDQDKEIYIEQVKGKLVNYVALAKWISETGMKSEFSFTGWEMIFLTEPMIAEKLIRVTETSKGRGKEQLKEEIDQMRDNKEGISLCKMNEYFGYMRARYFFLYLSSLTLSIMYIIWYVKKRDARVLVVANLLVGVGGVFVTVFGRQGIGKHGAGLLEWAVARTSIPAISTLAGGSTLTSPAGVFTGTLIDFEKIMQDFGETITATIGNNICTSACIVTLFFSAYMVVCYFALEKKHFC